MPPAAAQSNALTLTRRSAASARRENRNNTHTQHTQSHAGAVRRRKSRSPDGCVAEEGNTQSDSLARRKKRPATITGMALPSSSNLSTSLGVSRLSIREDAGDRGRSKVKAKTRPMTTWVDDDQDNVSIVTNIVQDHGRAAHGQGARSKRKEQSRSREAAHRPPRKPTTPEPAEDEVEPTYTGPLAQAEYVRIKQETESLRKQVTMSKKTILKQSKVIDDLRAELTSTNESHRTQSAEMEKLRNRSKKSDDLIATMESNLTCQICMEVLLKPYGLSPCGHVLCMGCLLNWFKAAPLGEDEMDDDDYPDALLYRKKSCPCCRTVVRSRPIPLYVVKSLASALEKSKASAGAARPSPLPDDEDPWAGIFRDPTDREEYWSTDDEDEDEDDDDDEEDDDDDDEDEDVGDDLHGDGHEGEPEPYGYDDYWSFDGYGTGEDEDHYDGPYVNPIWAPPTDHVGPDQYPFFDYYSPEIMICRRGATLEMIEIFQMTYEHDTGLCALVDGENEVYLGWNIELHPEDDTGEEYMDWVVQDMWRRPERWRVMNDAEDGTWRAWKLVPQGEDEEYDNTDSEFYLDDDEH